MKTTEHGIEDGGDVENMYRMRLMALLKDLVWALACQADASGHVHRTAALTGECEHRICHSEPPTRRCGNAPVRT